MSESEVQGLILEYLNNMGIYAWRNNSIGVYDPARKTYRKNHGKYAINGVSDILAIMPSGRFLAIEVKKPCKNPRTPERLFNMASEDQQKFIAQTLDQGGLAFVADRLDVVIDTLKTAC